MLGGTKVKNLAPEYREGAAEDEGGFPASAEVQAQLAVT